MKTCVWIQYLTKMVNVKKKKYIMTLRGVKRQLNTDKVTKISDLGCKHNNATMTFLGEKKQIQVCDISVIDFKYKDKRDVDYHCFWCKHSFETLPIGCPISYSPSKLASTYKSVINQISYTIHEDSYESTAREPCLTKHGKPFYRTDGVFCSFNCCKAYIHDNKTDTLYKNSDMLLVQMYNDIFKTNISNIIPAPHWRVLLSYGGVIDIEEFRNSFDVAEYQPNGIALDAYENLHSIGHLFEKRLKF